MNKSPVYLWFLKWFLLFIGGLSAFINTSLTAEAAKATHDIGLLGPIGIGLIMALILTAVEAVFGHILGSFESLKDLMGAFAEQWSKGASAQIWLVVMGPIVAIALAKVYEIDTSTTFSQLLVSGMPRDWAIAFSAMFVFSFEVCLIASRWVDRQRKKAVRDNLEKSTAIDADIKYHRSRYRAKVRAAEELGARNGYNEASERYAKSVEGR